MPLLPRRRRNVEASNPNALAASGRRVTRQDGDDIQRVHEQWQKRAFMYYRMRGEAWYAAQFYARMLSGIELYPAYKDPATGEIARTEQPEAVAELERIQDPGGGRANLLGSYGRLMFLNGEALLTCTKPDDEEPEQWEMLSVQEMQFVSGQYVRQKAPSLPQERLHEPKEDDDNETMQRGEVVVYRLWRRDPEWSELADSPMRAALDDFEELVILTRTVRARARSRLAGAGILFIDDRVSEQVPETDGDEDPVEDKWLSRITAAMVAPIGDEGVPSAVVPIVSRISNPDNAKISDLVYHLQLVDPTQLYPESGLRMECIQRIAIELDMPPEALTGSATLNHWSGWLVDEQTWNGHGKPVAGQLVDDVTAAFYRPALRARGIQDWQNYLVQYDPAGVIAHPNRTKDAKDLHDRGVLSDEALRGSADFDESDAPSDEERRIWLSVKSRDPQFALTGISATPVSAEEAPVDETVDPGAAPEEVVKGPPQNGNGNGRASTLAAAQMVGAAQMAMLRAREAAGSKVRSLAKRDSACRELLEGVPAGMVCATLGRERVQALRAPPEQELVRSAGPLIEDAFRVWGVGNLDLARMIARNVEVHAARTLYDEKPSPLPTSFTNLIADLHE